MTRTAALALLITALGGARAVAGGWVTAYYPGWRQARLAPDRIDYEAVTHVAHFSLIPRADGTLDAGTNRLTPANVAAAVAAAHGAGKKILVTIGGRARARASRPRSRPSAARPSSGPWPPSSATTATTASTSTWSRSSPETRATSRPSRATCAPVSTRRSRVRC
ncbi:MAG: hypothetical protein M0D55_05315 [Elusimicrobiota bacterium]|nr:MAG: hypothetical protein M0D55_05315 [Elusimicrobiota bacterium]